MAGRTQEALYAEIDLELSWSEDALPQVERTKHVHGLHPYLGKFVPQLVEVFLRRYFAPGDRVYDPFVGSGTTLVEANAFGADAIGCDISAFNCLLTEVKTARYSLGELELGLRGALEEARRAPATEGHDAVARAVVRAARARRAARLPRGRREAAGAAGVGRPRRARAARPGRRAGRRTSTSTSRPRRRPSRTGASSTSAPAARPRRRRSSSAATRTTRSAASARSPRCGRRAAVTVLHDDARTVRLPARPDGVFTSPPYPGLIDYHEQHRYAYELLGLADRRDEEIGAAAAGRNRPAVESYVEAMSEAFANTRRQLAPASRVLIVVNDSKELYPRILDAAGLALEERITRHVNRRTGRRAGEYFEDVLICRPV